MKIPHWTEGQIGRDGAGRTMLFCRTETGDFLAQSAQGHPMHQSQGDRAHVERYLAGDNPWNTTFHAVTTLESLWSSSEPAESGVDFSKFGLGGMARAVAASGADKRKHFEVSYGLMLASWGGDDVLENLLLGPISTLAIGVEKELTDRSIPEAERGTVHAALARLTEETRVLLGEFRRLRLDRGDLAADVSGLSIGTAVKGAQWLNEGMP